MKPIFVQGTTIGDTWQNMMWEIYNHGTKVPIDAGSFAGATRLEADLCAGTIMFPLQQPMAPIMPPGGPAPPTTMQAIQDYFVKYLMDPTLEDGEHYKYAQWINGPVHMYATGELISALDWCIRHFNQKPHNNHCCIKIGENQMLGGYDASYTNETERLTTPCLQLLDFKIGNDGKLHCLVVYRSWDAYAGWPENMGGFALLMEYIAAQIGRKVGTLSWSSLKLHAYDFQIEPLKAMLNKG
jgi:thymidylate synthase